MQNLMSLGRVPKILQQAFVKIINNKVCNAPYAFSGQVTDDMLCAGFMSGEADACQVCLDTFSNNFLPKYWFHGSFYQHKIFFCVNDFCGVASYFNPHKKHLLILFYVPDTSLDAGIQWWTESLPSWSFQSRNPYKGWYLQGNKINVSVFSGQPADLECCLVLIQRCSRRFSMCKYLPLLRAAESLEP